MNLKYPPLHSWSWTYTWVVPNISCGIMSWWHPPLMLGSSIRSTLQQTSWQLRGTGLQRTVKCNDVCGEFLVCFPNTWNWDCPLIMGWVMCCFQQHMQYNIVTLRTLSQAQKVLYAPVLKTKVAPNSSVKFYLTEFQISNSHARIDRRLESRLFTISCWMNVVHKLICRPAWAECMTAW